MVCALSPLSLSLIACVSAVVLWCVCGLSCAEKVFASAVAGAPAHVAGRVTGGGGAVGERGAAADVAGLSGAAQVGGRVRGHCCRAIMDIMQ